VVLEQKIRKAVGALIRFDGDIALAAKDLHVEEDEFRSLLREATLYGIIGEQALRAILYIDDLHRKEACRNTDPSIPVKHP